ncbi:MAG: hypothetical protein UV34_C0001G0030 [Parcubacteria group bacterium GW2011_GWB1_42_6]|nr:MAG: hypothetical protein UV34_C0001G0030 [Parcubacteria group bacterium GW2011_GWB1_42_6]
MKKLREGLEMAIIDRMMARKPEGFASHSRSHRSRNYFRYILMDDGKKAFGIYTNISTWKGRYVSMEVMFKDDGQEKNTVIKFEGEPTIEEVISLIPDSFAENKTAMTEFMTHFSDNLLWDKFFQPEE